MKKEIDKTFENYLTHPKPARIFELNANSSMHVGYVNVPENELLNYANTSGVLIKNNECAQKLDWGPFTYLIIESKTRKIVYKITMAEKVNNELIFAHLLRPLDMYDLMAVMQNDSQPGDIFLDTRTRGVYKIHKNSIELIGVY